MAISDKVAPEAGIAPASPRLQRGANLPQLLRVVVPRGNAPRSLAYRARALLLSYETVANCGFMPNRFTGRKTIFTFPVGRMRMARKGL